MSDKKLIAVCGATGKQGGSVLKYLVESGRYRVRALTRNTLSPKALTLKKYGRDVELFRCDLHNADDVIKAFEGCYGVYALTDFWDKPEMMATEEFNYGRILIDAAVSANVKHCIWSSLHNVDIVSGGKLQVPHFTNKALVEEYARNEFKDRNIQTCFSFVYPAFYMQNFLNVPNFGLHINKDGFLENDPLPIDETTRLYMINITEFGKFVLPMFDNFDQFKNGGRLFAYNDCITLPQFLGLVGKTLNLGYKYNRCTYDEFYSITESLEMVHMCQYFNEYGYYGGEDLGDTRKWATGLMSLQDAVNTIDWKSTLKPGITKQLTTKIGEVSGVVGEKLEAVKETIVEKAHAVRERMAETFTKTDANKKAESL